MKNEIYLNSISPKVELDSDFEKKIEEYAELICYAGVNVGKWKKVCINSEVENYYFANKCLEMCYKLGAEDAVIIWENYTQKINRLKNASDEFIDDLPSCEFAMYNEYIEKGYALIKLRSVNYEFFNEIPKSRLNKYNLSRHKSLKKFNDLKGKGYVPWVVSSVPCQDWAHMIFPEISKSDAEKKLWDTIFNILDINGDGKSLERWDNHAKILRKNCDKLNEFHLFSLHYSNSLGTDLTIELPKDHLWVAAGSHKTLNGVPYGANIPTEEVFTCPKKFGVNGIAYTSKPFMLNGVLITDAIFKFENGKIISVEAKTGEDILKSWIKDNKNGEYLGEVALVPYNSSISNTNLLFYDTLFDENAACHIAFGDSVRPSLVDGLKLDEKELEAKGANISNIHEDFMIGTSDLQIIGKTYDGENVQIFKDGNFCI